MKSKPVVDKQLADDIEKLLKDNDVDEKVIVEVVGKINNNDDNVDADGEEVDLFDDEPEKVEKDEDSEELDENSELEDEDLDTDEEESDEEDLEEESDKDSEEGEEDDESDEDEVEDEDEEDLEEDEEVEDEGEEEAVNPLAKLDDPKFREGFDKGYQFALALLKNNMLPEAEDSNEEVDEEEIDERVEDEDKVKPVEPQPEMPTEKKAVGDSVEALKEKLSAEINQLFKSRAKASEKVKPLVGSIRDVTVFDSAEAVYGFALKQNGVDIRKYKKDAYEGMVDVMLENLDKQTVNVVVGDAKDPDEFNDAMSDAFARLKKIEN